MKPDGLQVIKSIMPMKRCLTLLNHPLVYVNGNTYCCLLGPDPQAGIFGTRATVMDAFQDFDGHFKERLSHPITGDPVSDFIQQRHI